MNQIKYISGTLQKINSRSERTDFEFFLKLKTINSEGLIKKGKVTKTISDHLNIATGSIQNKLNRLIERGWIKIIYTNEKIYGYQLITYDEFYKNYGYKFKKKEHKKHRFQKKGCYNGKILKIRIKETELKKLYVHLVKTDLRQTAYLMENCIKGETQNNKSNSSYTADFSAQYISERVGCKSRLVGVKLTKKLKELGVDIKRNKSRLIQRGVIQAKAEFLPHTQYWFKGSIMEYRANSFNFTSY